MAENRRQSIRGEKRRLREGLSTTEVERNSRAVVEHLSHMTPLLKASVIMGYIAIDNEIDVWPFLEQCLSQGKVVVLPRIETVTNRLVAVRFIGEEGLRKGRFGLMEPEGDSFPPELIDAVIVPGLAFDMRGYRLGYGKGYYDRFLPELRPGTLTIGVAHSLQVADEIPYYPHDHRLAYLVTERGVIPCENGHR
ncbi:MAG: 5-formyltetrahydrofolate cyclo-ligase [Syntrophothermus sp.]|uniref:5-formyltetrahydrofolate cyclo-ligase n=1 Tax=Syntrophothermus sp. TaxID=2736299 RepID=UPI00257CD79E|nr:5-formyltetrahydrofolate cyclo-ligase [Syntrophothermus sp.]NSW82346.1 5-formyltetrahydrofolate cyclo-ligase [Syntrophothermus sp.]